MSLEPTSVSKNNQFNLPPPPPRSGGKEEPMGAGILEKGEERAHQEQAIVHIAKPIKPGTTEDIEKDPAYFGGITTDSAHKLLESKPVGSWLIRFSQSANQIIVTKKTGEGQYESIKKITIGGLEPSISNLPMDVIKRHFGEHLIVTKRGVSKEETKAAPLPPLSPASQPKLAKHPANFGILSRESAEEMLKKSDVPNGTWLVRTSKGQVVVSVKSDNNEVKHYATTSINGQPTKISDVTIEDLPQFNRDLLLYPENRTEGAEAPKSGESHGVLPGKTTLSPELNPRNANIKKDPAFSRWAPIPEISLGDKPIGAWMVYRENGNVFVVQKKRDNEYQKFQQISDKSLNDCNIDEVRKFFGEDLLVYPHGDLLPPTSFKPNYCIKFERPEDFKSLMNEWKNSNIDKDFKIVFDEKNSSILIPYSSEEMKALVQKHPFLTKYFGTSKRSLFDAGATAVPSMVHKVGLIQDTSSLLGKANDFFANLHPVDFDLNISPTASPGEMLNQILTQKNFSGVLIGENHNEHYPKRFLIEHMQQLKSEGVNTLFLEHLQYDIIQTELDNYMKGPDDKMPEVLEAYLDRQDAGNKLGVDSPDGFKALVKAAKKNNMRIVGIDTEASYKAGYEKSVISLGSEGPDRMKGLNYQAQEIIRQEGGSGKFVALVGNTHVSTSYKVSGLSEILGVPNIVFDAGMNSEVQTNVRNFLPQDEKNRAMINTPSGGGHIHVLITHTSD